MIFPFLRWLPLVNRNTIRADLIAGFPGESRRAFEQACDRIAELPLTHFHVFPFSPRPGTDAAAMEGRVNPREIRARAAVLRDLGRAKTRIFARAMTGRRVTAVCLDYGSGTPRRPDVLTGNYLRGRLRDGGRSGSGLFRVKVLEVCDDMLVVAGV